MQTGKAHMSERTTRRAFVAVIGKQNNMRVDACVYANVCVYASVWCPMCVHANVRECHPWSGAMSEAWGASCFAEVWKKNLNKQIAPVSMYSGVNRVDSVTQRPRGYVLLYLPSKTAVWSESFNCSLYLTFCFHSTGNLKDCCTCK